MKTQPPKRATNSELAYIRDLERESAFDRLDQGRAKIVTYKDFPEPMKRFLLREKTMVHVKLPATIKKALEARSRSTGTPIEELARRWIAQGLKREAS